MNLAEQLLVEISRQNTDFIAYFIGDDPKRFDELIELLFTGKSPIPLRASWVISAVTDRYPELLKPYLSKIIDGLKDFSHTGIHRNLLRQLSMIHIPDDLQGKLFDLCYGWLQSRFEPPAVKVHCMQVLFNISQKEPDLKPELRLIFEELMDHDSAAIRSRTTHLLAKL